MAESLTGAPEPSPTPRRKKAPVAPRVDKYANFTHSTHLGKAKLECSACHQFPTANWDKVRTGAAAFQDVTDYPKHESCLKCHMQQFFKGAQPAICTNCHTNPSPRDSSRHPFPNPREIFDLSPKGKTAESDFVVGFPHDKHIEIVSFNQLSPSRMSESAHSRGSRRPMAEESCSVCHQTLRPQGKETDEFVSKPPEKWGDAFWLKKGTFKTAPIGHTTCFTCHSVDAGMLPAPQNCAACHQLKGAQPPADFDTKLAELTGIDDKVMLQSWRRRDSSGTFRHEYDSHAETSCSTCHNVLTINTADPLTKKVGIAACATCHATATADDGGVLNYEIDSRTSNPAFACVKCHLVFGKMAIPESHSKALAAAMGK